MYLSLNEHTLCQDWKIPQPLHCSSILVFKISKSQKLGDHFHPNKDLKLNHDNESQLYRMYVLHKSLLWRPMGSFSVETIPHLPQANKSLPFLRSKLLIATVFDIRYPSTDSKAGLGWDSTDAELRRAVIIHNLSGVFVCSVYRISDISSAYIRHQCILTQLRGRVICRWGGKPISWTWLSKPLLTRLAPCTLNVVHVHSEPHCVAVYVHVAVHAPDGLKSTPSHCLQASINIIR